MEFTPRRVLLFLIVSVLVLLSWKNFVVEPMQEAQRRQAEAKKQAEADEEKPQDPKAEKDDSPQAETAKKSEQPDETPSPAVAQKPADVEIAETDPKSKPEPKPEPQGDGLPNYEHREVTLGSLDEDSGYFYQARLTSTGAAVKRIELNDPRYRDLEDPDEPLAIVQPVGDYRTFATAFFEILDSGDKEQLKPIVEDSVEWNLVEPEKPEESKVTFEYVTAKYRLTKQYTLERATEGDPSQELRDTETSGYFLSLQIGVENLQNEPAEVRYKLQGPVGMPLENAESTRKFRDIKIGAVGGTHQSLTVGDLVESIQDEEEVETWSAPFRYVGVDGQFFANLVYNPPEEDAGEKKIVKYVPQVVRMDDSEPEQSEISVLFTSKPISLQANSSAAHDYTLYAGPKRQALLEPMGAGEILEFGWFGWISKGMLAILSFLHNALFLPYGLAIIGLTILVRGALFPLSKKQAHSAKRMKELQPRLQELKKKYGDDKQKFAQAQMEMFRDAGYNPFAGCLPMILQLPIFIGLYSALSHAVDLRAASFLWVNDLASPDKLFQWPGGFRLPFLGQNFNLLPLVTVGLFLLQQKMFMPAPDPDDEQAQMQHKVMNFMMIFMGFLFYHVPAGLCVYFIASSLWGMGERKLLDYGKSHDEDSAEDGEASKSTGSDRGFKSVAQNGRGKGKNVASKKRGKKSKTRR